MGTVAKALELLDLFTRARPQIGLSEIARLSGVNKATCFRLMTEMQQAGLVEQITGTKEYRVGPAVLRLSAIREESVPLRSVVQPLLAALSDITGESAHASILVGDRVELVDYAYSNRHGTRVMLDDADHLPFHATSSGLAILAYLPKPMIDDILSRPLPRVTADTVIDPAALRTRIEMTRANGYSESKGTFEADVHSLAFPIFDANAACIGAIAVATPAARINDDLRRTILTETHRIAQEVTRRSGGVPPSDLPDPTL